MGRCPSAAAVFFARAVQSTAPQSTEGPAGALAPVGVSLEAIVVLSAPPPMPVVDTVVEVEDTMALASPPSTLAMVLSSCVPVLFRASVAVL